MAVRDDDDDDRPRKQKPRPSDEFEDDDRPAKKRRPRDVEDDRPRKRRRMDEDEEEDPDDLGNSPLGAVVPLGTSIWALASFYLALLSCVVPLPLLGLIAIVLGVVAFFAQKKKKASYGSITGNIRAVLGVLIGLVTMLFYSIIYVLWLTGKLK